MKLIHLKNLKSECVLVELPGGHTLEDYVSETDEVGLPNLFGKFTDLKEEDFDGLVHKSGNIYADYKDWSFSEKLYSYFNARESFISAIEAEGWYTENPYGKYDAKNTSATELEKEARSYALWQEAQEKVINLGNCYLFIKS